MRRGEASTTTARGDQAPVVPRRARDVEPTAPYLDAELVLTGAELTWSAGAHRERKGAGICHGTAGNGYALLAAFDRTGDELWLDRAHCFAVHALAQAERKAPLYALWIGAIGATVFASDCLDQRCRYPFLEVREHGMTLYLRTGTSLWQTNGTRSAFAPGIRAIVADADAASARNRSGRRTTGTRGGPRPPLKAL